MDIISNSVKKKRRSDSLGERAHELQHSAISSKKNCYLSSESLKTRSDLLSTRKQREAARECIGKHILHSPIESNL